MERYAREEVEKYQIFLHSHCQSDLEKTHSDEASKILETIKIRLSVYPQYAGTPLKGSKKLIYKLKFNKYRVLYTVVFSTNEVWVLAIEPMADIYREEHFETLLRIGISLHQNLQPSKAHSR